MNRDEFVEWFNGLNLIQRSLPDENEYFPNFNDEVILALEEFKVHPVKSLWENGLLDLDDDVNEYLPFSVRNPKYPEVPITFRLLLTHRSSIASRTINLFTLFSIFRIPYSNLGEFLNPGGNLYSPKNWKDYPPGEGQTYSCIAYELLGYLVECITNQAFSEYCTKYILSNSQKEPPALERVIVNIIKELAKLNPQSHVHASELYAAVNVIRRIPPGPILALLASRPWFIHVGDQHFRLSDAEYD